MRWVPSSSLKATIAFVVGWSIGGICICATSLIFGPVSIAHLHSSCSMGLTHESHLLNLRKGEIFPTLKHKRSFGLLGAGFNPVHVGALSIKVVVFNDLKSEVLSHLIGNC